MAKLSGWVILLCVVPLACSAASETEDSEDNATAGPATVDCVAEAARGPLLSLTDEEAFALGKRNRCDACHVPRDTGIREVGPALETMRARYSSLMKTKKDPYVGTGSCSTFVKTPKITGPTQMRSQLATRMRYGTLGPKGEHVGYWGCLPMPPTTFSKADACSLASWFLGTP